MHQNFSGPLSELPRLKNGDLFQRVSDLNEELNHSCASFNVI